MANQDEIRKSHLHFSSYDYNNRILFAHSVQISPACITTVGSRWENLGPQILISISYKNIDTFFFVRQRVHFFCRNLEFWCMAHRTGPVTFLALLLRYWSAGDNTWPFWPTWHDVWPSIDVSDWFCVTNDGFHNSCNHPRLLCSTLPKSTKFQLWELRTWFPVGRRPITSRCSMGVCTCPMGLCEASSCAIWQQNIQIPSKMRNVRVWVFCTMNHPEPRSGAHRARKSFRQKKWNIFYGSY